MTSSKGCLYCWRKGEWRGRTRIEKKETEGREKQEKESEQIKKAGASKKGRRCRWRRNKEKPHRNSFEG